MELVTMILACSLYPDPTITNAMLQVGSHNTPYTVTSDDGKTSTFTSAKQATSFVERQIQDGHAVNIGLMQIPSHWLPTYNATPADLFFPCKNMVLATKILNDAETQCSQEQSNGSESDLKACALSVYKTRDIHSGSDYANAVLDYAKDHPFKDISAAAEAKNPRGFHMIPGDAPTTASTQNAAKINPATDPSKKTSVSARSAEDNISDDDTVLNNDN